jgi:hypothetical protein
LAKANYHFFTKSKRLDFFSGIGLGMNIGGEKLISIDKGWKSRTGFTPIGIELGFGLRCKLAKNIGVYTEANLSQTSNYQAGIWYKFNKKIRSFRE